MNSLYGCYKRLKSRIDIAFQNNISGANVKNQFHIENGFYCASVKNEFKFQNEYLWYFSFDSKHPGNLNFNCDESGFSEQFFEIPLLKSLKTRLPKFQF